MKVVEGVDCTQKDCGEKVVAGLGGKKVDLVVYVSGVVIPEVSLSDRSSQDPFISSAAQRCLAMRLCATTDSFG